jgi:hypothetical protein
MTDTATSLGHRIRQLASAWATSQQALVRLAADFADGQEWAEDGSPSAAHWIAAVADIEISTAREWVRTGRALRNLPATAVAFTEGQLSYSKVRTLTRVATADNEAELLNLALGVPAGELGRTLAAWTARNSTNDELDRLQQQRRSVRWWVEPDGTISFKIRLPPLTAGLLIAWLNTWVMKHHGRQHAGHEAAPQSQERQPDEHAPADASPANASPTVAFPTVAQQHADAFGVLLDTKIAAKTEVVLHVRGDGCTLDDGTPVTDHAVASKLPDAFVRALVHDAKNRPVSASGRRRHPTPRQKRIVRERDRVCIDCGRSDLLEYDHNPAFEQTQRTEVDELELRCAPCHRARRTPD